MTGILQFRLGATAGLSDKRFVDGELANRYLHGQLVDQLLVDERVDSLSRWVLAFFRSSSLRQKLAIHGITMNQLIVFFDNETNDTVFDDAGEVVTPGGREFAMLLSEELAKAGITTSDVFQRSFYGWEFEITTESSRFLAVVQQAETWLVAIGGASGLFKRFMSRASEAELERIANAVRDAVLSTGIGTDVRIESA